MQDVASSRTRWWWMAGIALAFAVLVVPAILAGGGGTSQANDMMDYHSIEVRRLEAGWPAPDLKASFTTTTPGFHLVLAGLAKAGCGATALRLTASLAALGAWLVVWRVAAIWAGACRAALLVAPLALSPYLLGSAIWLTTDATALALACAAMGVALAAPSAARGSVGAGLLGAGTVLVRQIMLWAVVPAAIRAWRVGRGLRRFVTVAAVVVPPVACVAAFFAVWGGSMPPRFQPFHQATWNPAAITIMLAALGAFGVFMVPFIWRGLDRPTRRAALLWAVLLGALAAMPRSDYRKVLPPDEQRVGTRTEKTWGPTAPGVLKGAGEIGRWGGPLWDVANAAPCVADRSVALVGLSLVGGFVVAGLWLRADRAGRGAAASMLLAAMAAMVLAQCLNAQTFQRYFDPWALLLISWLAAMGVRVAREPWLSRGAVAMAGVQVAMSAAVVLRPAFVGPPLGAW